MPNGDSQFSMWRHTGFWIALSSVFAVGAIAGALIATLDVTRLVLFIILAPVLSWLACLNFNTAVRDRDHERDRYIVMKTLERAERHHGVKDAKG